MAVINIHFHHLFHEEHVIDKSRRKFQGRLRTSREDHFLKRNNREEIRVESTSTIKESESDEKSHKLAGLRCQEKYGGPDDAYAEKEMVFWSDIPSDASYKSPFLDLDSERYLAFEP